MAPPWEMSAMGYPESRNPTPNAAARISRIGHAACHVVRVLVVMVYGASMQCPPDLCEHNTVSVAMHTSIVRWP